MAILGQRTSHLLLIAASLLTGCNNGLDVTGLIRSETTPDERFVQSTQHGWLRFPTEMDLDTNSYSLIFAGDCHVGTTGNLETVLARSRAPEISALFLAGDVTTGHVEDYGTLKRLLDGTDGVSYYLMVGNHDLFFDGWGTFFSDFGASTYTVTINTPHGADLYIVLDTGGGTLGEKQLAWLKGILQHRSSFRNVVVVTHNNFFRGHLTESTNPLVEEVETLLDLFATYEVNMVVTGHDHTRSVEVFGVTTYITLDGLQDGSLNASYMKLTVSHGTLAYEFQVL
jgi:predicted phosphodiesterase